MASRQAYTNLTPTQREYQQEREKRADANEAANKSIVVYDSAAEKYMQERAAEKQAKSEIEPTPAAMVFSPAAQAKFGITQGATPEEIKFMSGDGRVVTAAGGNYVIAPSSATVDIQRASQLKT